jgi:hypothetical protein
MTPISCTLSEGLMPNEKIAKIKTTNGSFETVEVSISNVRGGKLLAYEVGRDSQGNVLIELPRESVSGRWRIWVEKSAIGG